MNNSKLRREQNESVFRDRNQGVKAILDSVLPSENRNDFILRFTCECSNEDCHEAVELSVADYEEVRKNPKRFIIRPGHQQPDIERVVLAEGYAVTEKHEIPPPGRGHLNSTH